MTQPDTTEDTIFQGRVRLFQPARGFRTGTDSLLLAAALPDRPGGHYLDVGCGCGGALLAAAWRLPKVAFTGLDIDPEVAALAKRSAQANGFADRVDTQVGQLSDWVRSRENRFDAVFSNPPYFKAGDITPPGEGRETAYVETIPLDEWLKAMVFTAKPRAPIIVIHRSAELARLLAALDRWTGEITVLPIAPHEGEDANRVLVRGRKGLKRGRVRLMAPLGLRDTKMSAPTEHFEAVRQGEPLVFN